MVETSRPPPSLPNLEGYLAFRVSPLSHLINASSTYCTYRSTRWRTCSLSSGFRYVLPCVSVTFPQGVIKDYRKRFFALPHSEQALSPPPQANSFVLCPPSLVARPHSIRQSECITSSHPGNLQAVESANPLVIPNNPQPAPQSFVRTPPPPPPRLVISTNSNELIPHPQHSPTLVSETSKVNLLYVGQPYKKECMRIIATFLRPGAVKELSLDDDLRHTVIRNLAYSTHPDVVSRRALFFTHRRCFIFYFAVSPRVPRNIQYLGNQEHPWISCL